MRHRSRNRKAQPIPPHPTPHSTSCIGRSTTSGSVKGMGMEMSLDTHPGPPCKTPSHPTPPHSAAPHSASLCIGRTTTSGSVTGVGVEVGFDAAAGADGPLVVVAPAPGGPAERAGIKPRDQILAIDGQPTNTLSLYAAGGAAPAWGRGGVHRLPAAVRGVPGCAGCLARPAGTGVV